MKKQLAKFLPFVMVFIIIISISGCKKDEAYNGNYNSGISRVDTDSKLSDDIDDNFNDYIKCPDFVGMSVSEIEKHKYYNDSTLRFTFEHMENDEYAISHICEQSIEPETQIKKGTVITLYVSTGASEIIIPNIYFMSETEAVDLINSKGFKTKVEHIADSDIEKGKVIKTSPVIGTKVTKNQTITIYVSNGNEQNYVPVPDVIGITRPVAIAKLESSGFTVKTIMQHNENYDYGFVFNTDPVPGTNLAEGKNITIYVSLGKADK